MTNFFIIELMDPNNPQPPRQNAPLSVPPRSPDNTVRDMPDTAFGFADDNPPMPETPPNPPVQSPTQLQAQPQPSYTPPATPLPAPAPAMPPVPTQTPVPPQSTMPPKEIPTVPTFEPAPNQPSVPPQPTLAKPIPQAVPQAAQQLPNLAVPAAATSYAPPTTHIPPDIAQRISETPMQSSSDIAKKIAHGGEGGRLKSLVSFLLFTATILVAAFLINQFIFQSYYVEGTSMTPTLQNNDRLIISKVEKTWSNLLGKVYIPQRGQVVVLDSSIVGLNGQKEQLIKRVIGLPGDQIHIENGVVTIKNSEHPKGYDVTKSLGLEYLQDTYIELPLDVTVPQGQVFVMGDNRGQNGSYDSRAFGPIDGDKIQGRLWARILPLDRVQTF